MINIVIASGDGAEDAASSFFEKRAYLHATPLYFTADEHSLFCFSSIGFHYRLPILPEFLFELLLYFELT